VGSHPDPQLWTPSGNEKTALNRAKNFSQPSRNSAAASDIINKRLYGITNAWASERVKCPLQNPNLNALISESFSPAASHSFLFANISRVDFLAKIPPHFLAKPITPVGSPDYCRHQQSIWMTCKLSLRDNLP
jgi:hypothetical protein